MFTFREVGFMNFMDIPDDTLDDKDFEEIGDDNYSLCSPLGLSDVDASLLEKFLELDIPLETDEILASDKACEILNRISQNGDNSFLDTLAPDLEDRTIGPKK